MSAAPFPRRVLWFAVSSVAALAVFALLAVEVDIDAGAVLRLTQANAGHEDAAGEHLAWVDQPPMRKLEIAELPCFGCHNVERYRRGQSFSHDDHEQEGVGHCHKCHAFEGHFEVKVRRETCEECH